MAMSKTINTTAVISKWGNSHGLRLPSEILRILGINANDRVFLEVENDSGSAEKKLVITKTPMPQKGTIEYLFKDYSGASFKTKLVNPTKPMGNEKW
jgi:antitoxin MazE